MLLSPTYLLDARRIDSAPCDIVLADYRLNVNYRTAARRFAWNPSDSRRRARCYRDGQISLQVAEYRPEEHYEAVNNKWICLCTPDGR